VVLQLCLLDEGDFCFSIFGALAAVGTVAERCSVLTIGKTPTCVGVMHLSESLQILIDSLEVLLLESLVGLVGILVSHDGMDEGFEDQVSVDVEERLQQLVFVVDVVQLDYKCAKTRYLKVKIHLLLGLNNVDDFLGLRGKFWELLEYSCQTTLCTRHQKVYYFSLCESTIFFCT